MVCGICVWVIWVGLCHLRLGCVYMYVYILFVMSLALFNLEIWCFVVLSPYWGQYCGLHGNFYNFSLYFSFVWRTGLAWFFLRVGLYFCICPIFRAISIGLTCRLVCISGFFTCGCYLVIGRILLVVVSWGLDRVFFRLLGFHLCFSILVIFSLVCYCGILS